jgi:hypothetical protein
VCIAYDIVLHFVVSDLASGPVLLLTDYNPFLTSLNLFFLVDVGVDPLCVRLLSPDPFSIILLKKKIEKKLDIKFE